VSPFAIRKLKILLVTERFHPSVGGVETVTGLLAGALVRLGHNVCVVTRELAKATTAFDFAILRRPGPISLLRHYATANAVIVQGLAIRLGWPLLWQRPGALAVHHIQPVPTERGAGRWLHAQLARRVRHAAVSKALAQQLPWPVETVLTNPYDAETFRIDPAISRTRDVLFVGRLIPEKGASVLVKALEILRQKRELLTATIVGEGPERAPLERKLSAAGLEKNMRFAGQVTGPRLAQLLNQHQLVVVPSLGDEAFGVVALEAIACGCAVIASHAGGLPEAIGPCGTTFPTGNSVSLATKIQDVLNSACTREKFRARAGNHLAAHDPLAVARRYLQLLSMGVHSRSFSSILG
jgi:glycogen(starch) synthase